MRLINTPRLRLRVVSLLLSLALCGPMALQAQSQIQISRQLPAPRYIPSHDFDTQNIR